MRELDRRRLIALLSAAAVSTATLRVGLAQQPLTRPVVGRELDPTAELMHQHGLLRRALRALDRSAGRLQRDSTFPREALAAAQLFQQLGTEHHELKLEEAYVFPDLRRQGGTWDPLIQTLIEQHRRGTEIVNFLVDTASRGEVRARDVAPLAQALQSLSRMYDYHTAVEESVVFPSWRTLIGEQRYKLMRDAFEQVGEQAFGRDGIAGVAKQLAAIERTLQLPDLAAMTAAAPPRR